MEWVDVFAVLSSLFDLKEDYDQSVLQRARTRVIMMWADVTSLAQRKNTLKGMKERLDIKGASYATQQEYTNNFRTSEFLNGDLGM